MDVGTISNDEAVPTLSIGDASVAEGNVGTANLVFTVTLSGASALPVTVDFATADGTETQPGDYSPQTGTLTFAPGETTKTITVAVAGDPIFEGDEAFFVDLSNAVGATLGDAQGEGTITNDDAEPATVNAKTPFTFKDANNDTVTVKLKGAGTVTVSLVGGVETGADIADISLTGTDAKSALSVTVKKDKVTGDGVVDIGEVVVNGALKSFTAKASDLTEAGLRATGPVKTITVRDFVQGEIVTGGVATDKLALTLGVVGDGVVIQSGQTVSILKAVSLGEASVSAAAFGAISTSAGAIAADITSVGAIAKITTKGGGLSGALSAASFGAVAVKGGDFSGSLTSLTAAATLGKIKALKSLAVTDGNLTGDVRLLGAAGVIGVKGKTLGGSITGASIVAASLAGVTTQRDVIGSVILAGADLGADFELGGDNDTFAGGSIAKVKIGGAVSGSTVIGAGLDPTDGIFANADDDVIGAVASVIKSFSITGTAAEDSHFAAGIFKSAPKITKVKVDAATDARFLIG